MMSSRIWFAAKSAFLYSMSFSFMWLQLEHNWKIFNSTQYWCIICLNLLLFMHFSCFTYSLLTSLFCIHIKTWRTDFGCLCYCW